MDEFDKNKYLAQLAKEKAQEALDTRTDIMSTREIVGDDVLQQQAEDMFGKTESAEDFQDRIRKQRADRGAELMEKAKQRGREMSRHSWAKDSDIGDKFVRRNKDILKTPEATKKRILSKLAGKGAGKLAGLAIGGPLALMSELADASEIGISERDKIIESTEYSPDEKKALLRGLDMKRKLASESGDVSQDPTVLKAREIGRRLEEEDVRSPEEAEAAAMENFKNKVSNEDYIKILRDMRNRNRRK